MASYHEQVAASFLAAPPEHFGDSSVTGPELGALSRLRAELGGRDAVLAHIIEFGYPVPAEITADDLATTGVAHACGVAIHLAEVRGERGKDSTYESYTAKNRFDRFVALNLPAELREEWHRPIERDDTNADVIYPRGVDINLIHGVGKPHRYLPAQTMRYLEFARLGKLDPKTSEVLLITPDTDLHSYGVLWDELLPVIQSATDVVTLAGDLGAEIARQLLQNGLRQEQVAAVLNVGFDVAAVRQEHGNVPQADDVYAALLAGLSASEETRPIAEMLSK